MSNSGFSFPKFFEDSKKVLLQPKAYFSSMETQGGIGEPLIKVLIYGGIAGVFALLWSLLNLTGFTGGLFGGAIGIAAFFWAIIGAVIGVFIGGVIVLVISAIASGNTDYEPNLRIAAAIMVLLPVNAFLGFLDGISYHLGAIIGLAVNLYGLYLLYLGVTITLKGKESTAKVVSYVLAGLLVLFLIIGMATRSKLRRFAGTSSRKTDKILNEYQKAAEKMAKDYQEAAENITEELAEEYEEATEDIIEEVDKAGSFQLQVGDEEPVIDISRSDLRKQLKKLEEDGDFAVLSKGVVFLRAEPNEEGFKAEYRDNSGFYTSVDQELAFDEVEDLFLDFYNEKEDWKESIDWE